MIKPRKAALAHRRDKLFGRLARIGREHAVHVAIHSAQIRIVGNQLHNTRIILPRAAFVNSRYALAVFAIAREYDAKVFAFSAVVWYYIIAVIADNMRRASLLRNTRLARRRNARFRKRAH